MFNILYLLFLIVKSYIYFLQRIEIIPLIKFSLIWPFILLNCIINNIFLLLDNIFFDFQNISIKSPLFILGFPRSGTTFFHKTLYNDKQFTTPLLWELIFAPSIIQKKIYWKIIYIFNLKSSSKVLVGLLFQNFDHIHPIRLNNPEEDYLYFIPYGACFLLIVIMPIKDIWNLIEFDTIYSKSDKIRLVEKYKRLIQRHLYMHGSDRIYLSKNPYFTPFISTIRKAFPDASIIGCYRNPRESIPSLLSNMKEAYKLLSRDITVNNQTMLYVNIYRKFYDKMLYHKEYDTSFEMLSYLNIKNNLFETISKLYKKFNYSFTNDFKFYVNNLSQESKSYISKHKYSLNDYNIDSNYINKIFLDINEK